MAIERLLCVTIDTEADCDVKWRRSDPLSFESVLYGIPNILRPIWNNYGIKPVYFVSPAVARNADCCRVLRGEIGFGAEISAHLHAEYIGPEKKYEKADGTRSDEYPCSAYSAEVELAKIRNLTELIEKNMGAKPISYRAARYGADLDTIKSLEALDYKVDSSVTPDIDWSYQGGPDHSKAPKQPYFVSRGGYYTQGDSKILEVPITISGKRGPFLPNRWLWYRWLRPTHMTFTEMRILAGEFIRKYDAPVLNMMFHSMEVIPGMTPFVRTALGQRMYLRRLEKILRYLKEKSFKAATLAEIYDEKLCALSQRPR